MRISPNSPRWRASAPASETSAHSSGGDLTRVRLASSAGIGDELRSAALHSCTFVRLARSPGRVLRCAASQGVDGTGWSDMRRAIGERARGGGRGSLHGDGTGGGPRRQPGGGVARPRARSRVFVRGADGTLAGLRPLRRLLHAVALARRLPGLGPGRGRPQRARSPTPSSAAATARCTRSSFVTSSGWTGWYGLGHTDAVRADDLDPPRQRHHRPLLARRRQRHRGQVLGARLRLDRRQQHAARPGPDRCRRPASVSRDDGLRGRDRPRHRRRRLRQHLQRLRAGAAGARSPAA